MSLALLFHYLLLNMFRMLIHYPQELATYLMSYFMGCIALVRCVLLLRCGLAGWRGIRMQAEAQTNSTSACIRIPQPNNTITPTHIETEQCNP